MDSDKLAIEVGQHSDKLSPEAVVQSEESLQVEVAYARPDKQKLMAITLPLGATIEDAVHRSGMLRHFPEINLAVNPVGIFGKLAKLDTRLRNGDRVEIYRPLVADPKEMRRQRALQGKKIKAKEQVPRL